MCSSVTGCTKGIEELNKENILTPMDSATPGVAPLCKGTIRDLNDADSEFRGQSYKELKSLYQRLTDLLDVDSNAVAQTVGVYSGTSKNYEASMLPTLTGQRANAELFAAFVGTLAPEIQSSVMMVTYKVKGPDTEYRLEFKTQKDAYKFMQNRRAFGISDLSFDRATNTLIVF
jgi:hypothetical protein